MLFKLCFFCTLGGRFILFHTLGGRGWRKWGNFFWTLPLLDFTKNYASCACQQNHPGHLRKYSFYVELFYEVVVPTLGVILCWVSCLSVTGGKPAGWCRCWGRAITSSRGRVGASLSSDPRWCEAITRWGYAAAELLIQLEELMDDEGGCWVSDHFTSLNSLNLFTILRFVLLPLINFHIFVNVKKPQRYK